MLAFVCILDKYELFHILDHLAKVAIKPMKQLISKVRKKAISGNLILCLKAVIQRTYIFPNNYFILYIHKFYS